MKKLTILAFILMVGFCAFAQKFEPEWAGEVNILKIDEDTIQ